MSELRPDIDLGRLARNQSSIPRPPRFKKIWLVPIIVLLAFLVLLASTLGDLLRGVREVEVIRPRPAEARGSAAGAVLLQAAGWVEPDPFPTSVTPLTAGVVTEMLVQESEPVAAGQVVARLVPDTKAADLALALAQVAAARARVAEAEVELANAEESFTAALGVTERLAVAEAELAAHLDECMRNEAVVRSIAARLEVAKAELETQRHLAREQAAGPWQVELATAKRAEMEAELDRATAEHQRGLDQRMAVEARVARARRDVELRLEDRLRVEDGKTRLEIQRGMLAEAEARAELARLNRDWCEVRAPAAGIVLERLAMPGSAVGGEKGGTAVCTTYDPRSLRVRVDVPQADTALLAEGLEALIIHNARPDRPYRGRVIRIVQRANIQKVTLEAQVAVLDGDGLLRPDMLCQVRFLGGAEEKGGGAPSSVLLVPQRLVREGDRVWVVDGLESKARLRQVRLGNRRGEDVEVLEGLNLSDKLIDRGGEGLEEGAPLRVREESR